MHLHEMSERKCDGHGCGHFDAPRGGKSHVGLDLKCSPKTAVNSPVSGTVTKINHMYSDDPSYLYVQVSENGYDFRVYYIEPTVQVGQAVCKTSIIGEAQDLRTRYQGITPHVHFEIKNANGEYIDPTPVMLAQRA
ncbi:peptidoglycan DD-metalloendopeptidase family protein [Marinobacter salarius]|uniref:peptidoglycan DD-metalloendopeptidase family protein n=1 Tax=Marinobacter salarius TaxID=1420917 RepID=UPI003D0CF45B